MQPPMKYYMLNDIQEYFNTPAELCLMCLSAYCRHLAQMLEVPAVYDYHHLHMINSYLLTFSNFREILIRYANAHYTVRIIGSCDVCIH